MELLRELRTVLFQENIVFMTLIDNSEGQEGLNAQQVATFSEWVRTSQGQEGLNAQQVATFSEWVRTHFTLYVHTHKLWCGIRHFKCCHLTLVWSIWQKGDVSTARTNVPVYWLFFTTGYSEFWLIWDLCIFLKLLHGATSHIVPVFFTIRNFIRLYLFGNIAIWILQEVR